MLIYLDMCCLKRPFDDQSQQRVRLETEIVLGLLASESEHMRFVRSPALVLENDRNPVRERAARVADWLSARPVWQPDDIDALRERVADLMTKGFRNFDALHLASAEAATADYFVTVDDRLLAVAARADSGLRTRVLSLVESIMEIAT